MANLRNSRSPLIFAGIISVNVTQAWRGGGGAVVAEAGGEPRHALKNILGGIAEK